MKFGNGIRRGTAALALSAGMLVVAAGAGVAYADQTVPETLTEFTFDNPAVTVPVGQAVHFTLTNTGRFPHSMTIDPQAGVVSTNAQPATPLKTGETGTFDVTFSAPGSYQFYCPVPGHKDRGMVGLITVIGAAGRAGGFDPNATAAVLGGLGVAALGGGLLQRRRAAATRAI